MDSAPHWFVVNVADAPTVSHPIAGTWTRFEDPQHPFQQVGVNLRVLGPGQPSTIYHAENAEETFLVISGHCLAIVGGQERELGPWDLLHTAPGVAHTFVGAGEGPCAILMIGARHPELQSYYPYSPVADAHGASAKEPTDNPAEAYAEWRGAGFIETALQWPPAAEVASDD
jgi:uncharacterized cupin superfamily protein